MNVNGQKQQYIIINKNISINCIYNNYFKFINFFIFINLIYTYIHFNYRQVSIDLENRSNITSLVPITENSLPQVSLIGDSSYNSMLNSNNNNSKNSRSKSINSAHTTGSMKSPRNYLVPLSTSNLPKLQINNNSNNLLNSNSPLSNLSDTNSCVSRRSSAPASTMTEVACNLTSEISDETTDIPAMERKSFADRTQTLSSNDNPKNESVKKKVFLLIFYFLNLINLFLLK
jgi:hypothetical protein